MSTISDALKKAQHQRTEKPPAISRPVPLPGESVRPAGRSFESRPNIAFPIVLLLMAIIAALVVLHLWPSRKSGSSTAANLKAPLVRPVASAPGPVTVRGEAANRIDTARETKSLIPASETVAERQVLDEVVASVAPQSTGVKAQAAPGETREDPPKVSPETRVKKPLPAAPVLNGVFYSTKNPMAIINGESVTVGETVGGYRILEILPESVRLGCDGEEIAVKLK